MPDATQRIPQQTWKGTGNWGPRPRGAVVSCLVLHADAADEVRKSIAWIQNPASKVSYHAIVGRTGIIYGLVAPQNRAWHAGVSEFGGVPNCNDYSVGLCFSNRCDGAEPYTDAALDAGAYYAASMMLIFPALTSQRITTHEEVARPRGRKHDPGPRFDATDFLGRVARWRDALAGRLHLVKTFPEL